MKKMDIEKPVIVFSLDCDWAKDEVLEWALKLFKDNGLPVTVFATHKTDLLLGTQSDALEVGIHPDFYNKDNHREIIKDLLNIYPDAKGVRSHCLFEYADLMNIYKDHDLAWDSSQLLYLHPHLSPYRHPSGLVRLPIFWEDDDYFSCGPDWKVEKLGLERPGVKCFDFHPVHLCLNTFAPEQYVFAKERQFSSRAVEEAAYKGSDKGTLAFFHKISDYVKKNNLSVSTLGEVCAWD